MASVEIQPFIRISTEMNLRDSIPILFLRLNSTAYVINQISDMISLGLLLGLTIPFNIDRRPLPSGNDFSKILPAKVGSFTRTAFTAPGPGMDGEAKYTRKNEEIFMLFSFADTDADRVETMKTIYSELKINATTEHPLISIKTNPSYLHYVGKDMAFFAWTRGKYCFSADAWEGNKKTLTDFMEQFPH